MDDSGMISVAHNNDEEHALAAAMQLYLAGDKHDPVVERNMLKQAHIALETGRQMKRPKDVDLTLWQEASAALLEAAQHKILADGRAVVLGFMPVTIGVKGGSVVDCGGAFNALKVNEELSEIIADMGVTVADALFTEAQVKDAQGCDLHCLMNTITGKRELSGYWAPRTISVDESVQYVRSFLAVVLTVNSPVSDTWHFEMPFEGLHRADPEQYLALEKTLWTELDKPGYQGIDVSLQIMEPLLHADALAESQTQMDLLKIEQALERLNARVDQGELIAAELRLQVIWPQESYEDQPVEAQPSLRMRIIHTVDGSEAQDEAWYPISYDSRNVDLWHDLLVETMQMVYSLGHGFLQVEQISGSEFQKGLMANAMPGPSSYQ